jgi:hypothetical protein
LCMRLPQRTPRGPDISASLRSTEFRWSRRAESEAPLRCCFLQLAHRRDLCAGEICPRLQVVNQTGCLPKPANQRVCATDDIIFVRSNLSRTPDVVLSFGLDLGRHTGIGRNRDSGGASLSKPFRINHFASVSAPSNTLCFTWGAKLLPLRVPPHLWLTARGHVSAKMAEIGGIRLS